MTYVIAEPCINTKDTACVEVCPVDCIHPKKDEAEFEAETKLYIDPETCIDCGACVPVCPVQAIFPQEEVPEKWTQYTQIDADWWQMLRDIPVPTLVLRGAESTVLDRDVAERMGKELPRGRFVEIPRAVHTLHEDNPDAVVAALKEFLGF